MIVPAFVIGMGFLSLAIWIWIRHDGKSARNRYLRSRPMLSVDNWYQSNFEGQPVSRQRVIDVCGRLAHDLGCEMTQILASDRFDAELKWPGWTPFGVSPDNEMEMFWYASLPKYLGKNSYEDLASEFQTVSDVRDLALACERLSRQ